MNGLGRALRVVAAIAATCWCIYAGQNVWAIAFFVLALVLA